METTKEEAAMKLKKQKLMNTPNDLEEMQLRPAQVWNCDEMGFDPNGNWCEMMNTQMVQC